MLILKMLLDYSIIISLLEYKFFFHVTLPCDGLFPLMVFLFSQYKLILSWDLFPWESHVLWIMEAFLRGVLFSPLLGPCKFS